MISGIVTAILLASFLAGSFWVFSSRRRSEFAEAERLALEDEIPLPTPASAAVGIAREENKP